MFKKNKKLLLRRVENIITGKLSHKTGTLTKIVEDALSKKSAILSIVRKHKTPFYIFDRETFQKSLKTFSDTFQSQLHIQPYYAVKANPHPYVLNEAVRAGYGLDVSSGRELDLALAANAKKILYTGPAKSMDDLNKAVRNSKKVIINIDSFRELQLLGEVAKNKKVSVECGIRISTKHHGNWSKFGILLEELPRFLREAKKYPLTQVKGIQTHLSFVETPDQYVEVIKEIGLYIRKCLMPSQKKQFGFFDFGGGFWPYKQEGFYPWDTAQGSIMSAVDESFYGAAEYTKRYYIDEAPPLKTYAKIIGAALKKYIEPELKVQYFCEPGRIVVQPAMHIVLRVADSKRNGVVITDGATNMVGWEKFETTYCPVINFTRPAKKEIPVKLYGSLCTPHDMWGNYCFAKKVAIGDVLVIPNQGAYVYTYAQNFIHPIPPVYPL